MKDRTRITLLKAALKGTRQELKRLRRKLQLVQSASKIVVNNYHTTIDELKDELNQTNKALEESRRKKWYQFKQI